MAGRFIAVAVCCLLLHVDASVLRGVPENSSIVLTPKVAEAIVPGAEVVKAHHPIAKAAEAVEDVAFKPAGGVPGAEVINAHHPIAKATEAIMDDDEKQNPITEEDIDFIGGIFGLGKDIENWKPYPLGHVEDKPKPTPKPTPPPLGNVPSSKEAPKCDQVCTNGHSRDRDICMIKCVGLRKDVCPRGVTCHEKCNNQVKRMKKDQDCETLCQNVRAHICAPFPYAAPESMVSPHHDHQPPPSAENTPAPRAVTGSFQVCNLFPADYTFEVFQVAKQGDVDGKTLAALRYEECGRVELSTLQMLGLRVQGRLDSFGQRRKGQLSGISRPIYKIPSMMVFGISGFNDYAVMFEQYFVQGAGAMVCNGFPLWTSAQDPEPVQLLRGDFQDGKKIASLKYRECTATGLGHGDIASVTVRGKHAGQYHVKENPAAIILGKAGETTAFAFEASGDIRDVPEALL